MLRVAAPLSNPNGPARLFFDGSKPLDLDLDLDTLDNSNVQLWYTVGASPAASPTTSRGAIPTAGTNSSGPSVMRQVGSRAFSTSTTFQVIGCKTGARRKRPVTSIAYDVQLNSPTVLAVNSAEDASRNRRW